MRLNPYSEDSELDYRLDLYADFFCQQIETFTSEKFRRPSHLGFKPYVKPFLTEER
jgi:hypothetical protein